MENNDDIIKALKIIQALNKQSEAKKIDESSAPAVRSLKAAIPYLSFEQQKPLYIMLKIMEISDYMKKCQEAAAASPSDLHQNIGILMAVREQLGDSQKKLIDAFIKIFEINRLMNTEMNNNVK